ncbi:cobalamin-5'-phosphate synthase [Mesorhizobium albiziae]|uniref:Adenosylcobinamide-GDP ribazoletransferase n=1 Tax=Neomesorhizobium albiziae TaxID=335020 RepID=A0A1I3WAJ3_9HYPH|nr:adenosylcobinamide-GDP ribazoletransferase [Mesorhizobium albiziae]GLS31465.1 adenosylcobinamide-GDP ribazoletransferase [Mesorhizobium albiziae]SFK04213.1 cobalamin-5'-phosphate synthase [Mesorhizobium albiziae]
MFPSRPQDIFADIALCLAFYTRLPVPVAGERDFAAAQWAAPVAGLAVGLIGGLVLLAADFLGLPETVAAALAVASTVFVTGALHEDGLSDMADGFGGGKTRERKLEIMRDSRIGSFGATALVFSILLRWSAIAAFASPWLAFCAVVASHAAGRAMMPVFLNAVAPARSDGLSAGAGSVPDSTALLACAIAAAVVLLTLGLNVALVSAIALVLVFFLMRRLCERQIGGQTGDVLGAVEQASEITVLLVACAILT